MAGKLPDGEVKEEESGDQLLGGRVDEEWHEYSHQYIRKT